ncbi:MULTISPECIES: hypothetical protein [Sulfitobacter]|jgi:hypothetical protein|uniref:Uncharacterized protein n=1 Tax=Sulfitobacter profundi TaxID=2679961 RepID=A0ABW1Z3B2_9RHOB|nr:hypothetical protein [Sulfitobacter indolifex]|tara:strand:- start:5559 stop:5714 length:156 start_codon:yes stop_codon:yes gene_type:complete
MCPFLASFQFLSIVSVVDEAQANGPEIFRELTAYNTNRWCDVLFQFDADST